MKYSLCSTLNHAEFRVKRLEIYREFQERCKYLGNIRNDTVLNKIVVLAKTRELRDEERATPQNINLI